jgi:glutaredoxin 2
MNVQPRVLNKSTTEVKTPQFKKDWGKTKKQYSDLLFKPHLKNKSTWTD